MHQPFEGNWRISLSYLPSVDFSSHTFEYEASVIIPVRNRIRTVKDAVRSALNQQTTFPFNVIVIDNHSTDGTSEVLRELSSDKRLIHVIPERNDLGIGGCWNIGIQSREMWKVLPSNLIAMTCIKTNIACKSSLILSINRNVQW